MTSLQLLSSQRVIENEIAFINNTDEKVVLGSSTIAFYYGVPVIRADVGEKVGGASFGIIILDDYYSYDKYGVNTLKHEYGHRKHMDDIGVFNYFVTTAIPSLIGAGLSNAGVLKQLGINYYSLPWEYTADMYGGVNRVGYNSWAGSTATVFRIYTLISSTITGGV